MRFIQAKAIRQLRFLLDLSQADLAAKLSYSRSSIARWEAGKSSEPHIENHLTLYAWRCGLDPIVQGDFTTGYVRVCLASAVQRHTAPNNQTQAA